MSDIGNGEHDFEDYPNMEAVPEAIKTARLEARGIIGQLEPLHIKDWASLIQILEEALASAKTSRGFAELERDWPVPRAEGVRHQESPASSAGSSC